jgi:hypothetical protein
VRGNGPETNPAANKLYPFQNIASDEVGQRHKLPFDSTAPAFYLTLNARWYNLRERIRLRVLFMVRAHSCEFTTSLRLRPWGRFSS